MGKFDFDPTTVKTTITVADKGSVEFQCGEPKPFSGTTKSGKNAGSQNHGVMYPLSIVAPERYKGGRQFQRCYMQNEGAAGFSKSFLMAALGYNPKSQADEEQFDTRFKGADWSYDPETGASGDVWREVNGAHIIAEVDVDINDAGEPTQKFISWRPAAAVNA